MDIQISCQHTTLTQALRAAVQEHFDRLAGHTNAPTSARITMTVDGADEPHLVEATLLVNGKPIHASSRAQDMYTALDSLVAKLDRRLRKSKTARLSSRTAARPAQPTM